MRPPRDPDALDALITDALDDEARGFRPTRTHAAARAAVGRAAIHRRRSRSVAVLGTVGSAAAAIIVTGILTAGHPGSGSVGTLQMGARATSAAPAAPLLKVEPAAGENQPTVLTLDESTNGGADAATAPSLIVVSLPDSAGLRWRTITTTTPGILTRISLQREGDRFVATYRTSGIGSTLLIASADSACAPDRVTPCRELPSWSVRLSVMVPSGGGMARPG